MSGRFRARHGVTLADGSAEAPHDHDWQVVAVFRARALDERGFVVDFLAVRDALADVTARLGGADLNRLLSGGASAERLAEHLAAALAARALPRPYCVRVREAEGCWAACYPGSGGGPEGGRLDASGGGGVG